MSKSRLSTSILALLIISAVAAASLTGCATIGFGSGKAPTKIAVLHTNDIHSNLFPWSLRTDSGELVEVGGLARIATIVEETRRGNCPVLLLNSGDSFYPNSLSKWHGSPEIGALNMTGYDCATLGNHEFDLGDDYLGQVLDIAKFPFVCANLEVEASPPLAGKLVNYAIKNIGGCSVGIFGLITPDLDTIASPSDNIVIDRDLAGLTGALVAYLDPRTDLIFALTHIGLPMDIKLAESVSGIDAIFGGHSHDAIHEAVEVTNPAGGRTLVLQSGCYGRYVGKLELTSALDAIDSYEWTLLEVNSEIKENEPVASYLNAFQEVREDPIGIIESELKISGDAIRGQDSTIGTLVCDAIAEEFPTASVIIVNTGGIRGGFQAAGPITRSRVDEILPFHNKIVLMWVTGAELRTTLERSVRSLPESSGALLQLRGIKAYVDVEGSPIMSGYDGKVLKPGERIKSVTVAGKPLDENGEYLVATINYLAGGGDGYAELAKVERQMDTGKSLNDILANYIEQHSPIYPKRRVTYEFTSPN